MPSWIIYGMVYAGSALMVYNIISYIRFELRLRKNNKWDKERRVLQLPIFLLVMFLFGYLAVGIFGNPDIIISGILFGGSVFVSVMFELIQRITNRIQENERLEAELKVAEETSRVKSTFLSNMSHEMRTPLNAIMGLNAEIVAELLSLEGISSDRAENGLVAVDKFSRSKPGAYDAILMDLRMPVMDGLDATRIIRDQNRPDAKTIPIIALSANAFDEDVRNSLEAGMNAHLSKPVEPERLYETLRRLIKSRGAT